MSNTIAHRPHAHHHVPLLPIFAVIAAVLIATAVLWAINRPEAVTTTTTSGTISAPAVVQPAVAVPDSPVFRHALMRVNAAGGYPPAYVANLHHLVNGKTLGLPSSYAP
jgi:hypothetical protein